MEQIFPKSERCELAYKNYQNTDNNLHVINHGALMLCLEGKTGFSVNFNNYLAEKDYVMVFFPGETITWNNMSEDFRGIILRYDESILREASMQVEFVVYSFIRNDRLFHNKLLVNHIIKSMFNMLVFYFSQQSMEYIDTIVTLELKSFFIGTYDFLLQNPDRQKLPQKSLRSNELFSHFMELLEHNYKKSHDVQYYADELCITRKYLSNISKKRTGKAPKKLIDEYVILQLKLTLHNTNKSIKEIASDFHFGDISFFVRYFKLHCGMPPLKFRQKNK